MNDKKDIELSVFNKNGSADYLDIKGFDDDIEFINFDKAPVSFTDRIKNITNISNRELLLVTTMFFALFVVCEVIGGLASNSLSLLGDAGAMTIDVCSYGFNFFAEHMKSKETPGAKSSMSHDCLIEVFIPGVSVLSLLLVTGWVCSDAVMRLLGHKEEDVDVAYLYSFAVANLVVDVVCTWLFYVRRQDVFLQPSKAEHDKDAGRVEDTSMGGMYDLEDVEIVLADYDDSHREDEAFSGERGRSSSSQLKTKNLNMISAFTHVGGDTLRSVTVLLAALASSTFNIDPALTDAVAAIVVSVTIVVAVSPLMYSLGVTVLDYRRRFSAAKTKENYRGVQTEAEDEAGGSHHSLVEESSAGGRLNSFPSTYSSSNISTVKAGGQRQTPALQSQRKPPQQQQQQQQQSQSQAATADEVEDEITL